MKDKLTEGMGTQIVGSKAGALIFSYKGINIPISNLYEGRRIMPTDVDCFGRMEHEIVIDCRRISLDQVSWAWDILALGKMPGAEAIIYGGFNHTGGKLVPIMKFKDFDINVIEKEKKGFRLRAVVERVFCS